MRAPRSPTSWKLDATPSLPDMVPCVPPERVCAVEVFRGVCDWYRGAPCLPVGLPRLIGGRVARMRANAFDVSCGCSAACPPFEGCVPDASFGGVERTA